MFVRGMSFQAGVFYMTNRYIACASHHKGKLESWILPHSAKAYQSVLKEFVRSIPIRFWLIPLIIAVGILLPPLIMGREGLPIYLMLYALFGMHLWFPKALRQYHGAEHKVFSTKGLITPVRMRIIRKASIVNRGCSTNVIVVYFCSVMLLSMILYLTGIQGPTALSIGSYSALLPAMFTEKLMTVWPKRFILPVSAFLQRKITTKEPDKEHLMAAIASYRLLAEKEFPHRIRRKRKERKKQMAIVDVTIIPIGTKDPSVSTYVASVQEVLKSYEGKIKYELTPMSTLIEGELPVLFEVIQAIHEVPFNHGIQRVATNIRIDDRRDKVQTMESKLTAVQEKMDK